MTDDDETRLIATPQNLHSAEAGLGRSTSGRAGVGVQSIGDTHFGDTHFGDTHLGAEHCSDEHLGDQHGESADRANPYNEAERFSESGREATPNREAFEPVPVQRSPFGASADPDATPVAPPSAALLESLQDAPGASRRLPAASRARTVRRDWGLRLACFRKLPLPVLGVVLGACVGLSAAFFWGVNHDATGDSSPAGLGENHDAPNGLVKKVSDASSSGAKEREALPHVEERSSEVGQLEARPVEAPPVEAEHAQTQPVAPSKIELSQPNEKRAVDAPQAESGATEEEAARALSDAFQGRCQAALDRYVRLQQRAKTSRLRQKWKKLGAAAHRQCRQVKGESE